MTFILHNNCLTRFMKFGIHTRDFLWDTRKGCTSPLPMLGPIKRLAWRIPKLPGMQRHRFKRHGSSSSPIVFEGPKWLVSLFVFQVTRDFSTQRFLLAKKNAKEDIYIYIYSFNITLLFKTPLVRMFQLP